MPATTLPAQSDQDLRASARRAVEVLREGGLIVFPTETGYALGGSAASDRVWAALRTSLEAPCEADAAPAVYVDDPQLAAAWVERSPAPWRAVARKLLAAPLRVRVETSDDAVAAALTRWGWSAALAQRAYRRGTVTLRGADHEVTRQVLALLRAQGTEPPLLLLAVELAAGGAPAVPVREVAQVPPRVGERAELVLDGGRCRFARPATVVRLREHGGWPVVAVEQAGLYDERIIRRLAHWSVLFVCTGNTCRSPMAQALAQDHLAKQRGLSVEELETAGVKVASAGVYAGPGLPASAQAAAVMHELGLDLAHHRSRPLTPELAREADVIFAMTQSHQRAVLEIMPETADRMQRLDPHGDVADPIGADVEEYRRCVRQMQQALAVRFKELVP